MRDNFPPSLRDIPWVTFFRKESTEEFITQWLGQRARAVSFSKRPSFLIVGDFRNCTIPEIEKTWDSLRAQSYGEWKLYPLGLTRDVALKVFRDFPRICFGDWEEVVREGSWVGWISGGDVLSPAALYFFAEAVLQFPDAQGFFSGEAQLDSTGKNLLAVLSKGRFSSFDQKHFNSVGRFSVLLPEFFSLQMVDREDEYLRELSQKQGFFLKLVPRVLYYRLKTGIEPGFAGASKTPPVFTSLSAVICFRDKAEMTVRCLEHLGRALKRFPKIHPQIILVNNGSQEKSLEAVVKAAEKTQLPYEVYHYDGPFHFARQHNEAIRKHARGELLLFLNNDVYLGEETDFNLWAQTALDERAGTVGICLRYPDGKLQHAGIRAFFGGEARLARLGNHSEEDPWVSVNRSVFASTFAACVVRRSVFERVGGLRELELANGFGDVCFSLECLRLGLENRYLGTIEAIHEEGASRGIRYEYWEERILEEEYPQELACMLREDLGWNRLIGKDYQLLPYLKTWTKIKFRNQGWNKWFTQ